MYIISIILGKKKSEEILESVKRYFGDNHKYTILHEYFIKPENFPVYLRIVLKDLADVVEALKIEDELGIVLRVPIVFAFMLGYAIREHPLLSRIKIILYMYNPRNDEYQEIRW